MSVNRRAALGFLAGTPVLAASAAAAATGKAAPAGPWTSSGDIPVGGGSLHWDSIGRGSGDPLILLHKLGGWTADWRHVAPLVAQGRRVIAFDLPGHGQSKMHGPAPWMMSVPEVTTMILSALDEMGVGRFDVAGNSLGGIAGVLLAALWPDRVRSLTLISASLIDRMSRAEIEKQDIERASSGGVMGMKGFATLVPSVTEEQIAGRAAAGAWLRPCERGVAHVGVTDYLPRIKAPTLMLNADRGTYARHVATGKRLIPNVQSVLIAQSGSFVHQEKPMETAAAMNIFLSSVTTG